MIYIEAGLLAILSVMLANASITDMRNGRISNKTILICLGVGALCAIPYYIFFATDCLLAYGINLVIVICISILLYAMGIWGAGDSKLLVASIVIFPARLYCLGNRSIASSFLLISFVFIIAFLYVVVDTLYLGIKQRDLFKKTKRTFAWKGYIKGFLFFFFMLSIINAMLALLLPDSILLDSVLLTAIHFIFILIGMRLEEKANWIVIIIMGIVWTGLLVAGWSKFSFANINWISYLIVVLLLLFRLVSDKYNYKTIPVSELKPGMILSVGSVLTFSKSRVSGLPAYSSEDLKSRLTAEEVESINRWSTSKYGQETITIVRKIPFALFIAIGAIVFTVLEVVTK